MPGMIKKLDDYEQATPAMKAAWDCCEAVTYWNEIEQTPKKDRRHNLDEAWDAAMILLLRWQQLADG